MKSRDLLKRILVIVLCVIIVLASAYAVAMSFHHHYGNIDFCPFCRAMSALINSVQIILSELFLFFYIVVKALKRKESGGYFKIRFLKNLSTSKLLC